MTDAPKFQVASLDEIEGFEAQQGYIWRPVRQHFGIRAFGINTNSGDAGTTLVDPHDEVNAPSPHEELYIVLSGDALFTLDEQEIEAPAGTAVFVPDPAVNRTAKARADGTTILCLGAPAGEAFKVSGWEFWRRAEHERSQGNDGAAVRIMREAAAERPDDGGTHFNLACMESLTGRHADAVESVRRAIELDPKLKELARADEDFEALRDDPEFQALLK
ncbi:MAG: hypothetical protein QOI71_3040 [Gaiellales bacterium]|nr:hypothetical protein [Gaiellales bacterium]